MQSKPSARRARPTAKDPVVIQLTTDGFEARDISATGAGVFVPTHLEGCPLKSPVHLVIKLPESEPIRARGRIVHRTKLEREFVGLEFVHLSEAHAALIARYVERIGPTARKASTPSPRPNVERLDASRAPDPGRPRRKVTR